MKKTWLNGFVIVLAAILLVGSLPALVQAEEPSDKWTFSLTPYLWAPKISGDLKYSTPNGSSGKPQISVKPDDYLADLNFGAIFTVEAKKGKWAFISDIVYMKLKSSGSKVKDVNFGGDIVSTELDIGTENHIQNALTTTGVGYTVIDGEHLKTDLVAGVRYLWLDSKLDWNLSADVNGPLGGQTFARSGALKETSELWNGIAGIRGQYQLGASHWAIPYYADLGTGDSDLTWQVYSGLNYCFQSWDAKIGYRYLTFQGGSDEMIEDLTLHGPTVGATFRF